MLLNGFPRGTLFCNIIRIDVVIHASPERGGGPLAVEGSKKVIVSDVDPSDTLTSSRAMVPLVHPQGINPMGITGEP